LLHHMEQDSIRKWVIEAAMKTFSSGDPSHLSSRQRCSGEVNSAWLVDLCLNPKRLRLVEM
jgi:hypothetical protein